MLTEILGILRTNGRYIYVGSEINAKGMIDREISKRILYIKCNQKPILTYNTKNMNFYDKEQKWKQ
jgi:hypothetical protein